MERKNKQKKIVVIYNPKSGKKTITALKKRIKDELKGSMDKLAFEIIRKKGDAAKLVHAYLDKHYSMVVAAGGDGTINEIAMSLVGKETPLGIIPLGSGNGFARSLHIPIPIEKSIEIIKKHKIILIDVGCLEKSYFFCTSGVGLDAQIGRKFEKEGKRGFFGYVSQVIKVLRNYGPKKYVLDVDGRTIKQRAVLITIANAPQWGNNAFISPNADLQDGYLDVSILKPFPWIKTLSLAIRLFNGKIDQSKYMDIYRAKEIQLRRKKKKRFWMHMDGEPIKVKNKVKISIVSKGLRVVVPR